MALVCAVGAVYAGLVDAAAQVAVVQGGEQGLLRGVHDDDGVGGLAAAALGVLLALGDVCLAQSGQFVAALHPHDGIVGGSLQLVAPLLLQVADAQVDGLHALHLVLGQQGAAAHEVLVRLL